MRGVCLPYILEQGVLDHAGCRYVLSGCMFAGILVGLAYTGIFYYIYYIDPRRCLRRLKRRKVIFTQSL